LNATASPQSLNEWLDLLEVRHPTAIDLGLERCRAVWQRMGSPRPARAVFVVAGTNGKGSTVATICGLLDGLGHRYGSYTTPHLYRYNERVQVQGRPVNDEALLHAFDRVEAARRDTSLTYFEFGTLAAFQVLAEAELDYAVMEIGLGGRLDAVNLLDADVAVITPIGLDHQEYLGNDLDGIGREKAGVMRPRQRVVCGDPDPPASVLATAAEMEARLLRLGVDFSAVISGDTVRYSACSLELELPLPSLPGPHQINNMATGLAAVLALIPEAADDSAALARGLRSVRLPGRLERIAERPVLWLDVGHNPLGARAVAVALGDIKASEGIENCRCVIAMLADKDVAAAVAELKTVISHWYCASLPGSRGQSGEQLAAKIAGAVGNLPLQVHASVKSALQAALADAGPDEGVLVFGSFLTVAEAGNYWRGRARPEPPGSLATSRDGY